MNIFKTDVLDVYILEPKVFGDHRGWFMESWSQRKLEAAGLYYNFVQDNQSYSAQKGTLRGYAKARSPIKNGWQWNCQLKINGSF